ncbi:hypothetical protein Y88_0479 [Novosphingobium nitrogenifigens DSM 19370]|uniref:Uncharacterized protein n=1 Tax=Novosphingobium nitrogenifigens DSM 19370 TaxID=983920 RepID=F1ZAG8_9SPHN|nr:hypothetical protein Y88_0479 [Novosphingobium nitrogenifigens DSM 19370]
MAGTDVCVMPLIVIRIRHIRHASPLTDGLHSRPALRP